MVESSWHQIPPTHSVIRFLTNLTKIWEPWQRIWSTVAFSTSPALITDTLCRAREQIWTKKKQDGQSSSGWRPLISFQPPRLVIIWQTEKAHFGMLWSSSVLPGKIQLNLPKKLIQKQFVCPSAVATNSSDLVVDGSPKNQRNTQDRYAGLESLVKKGVRGAVSARG